MEHEKLEELIHIISKGDTSAVELLFDRPGGRTFLESVVLAVVCNLPYGQEEKEDVFNAFRKALSKIEKRIKHQRQGQQILEQVHH
jgi:ribosome-associated translation inhibitor RaiA